MPQTSNLSSEEKALQAKAKLPEQLQPYLDDDKIESRQLIYTEVTTNINNVFERLNIRTGLSDPLKQLISHGQNYINKLLSQASNELNANQAFFIYYCISFLQDSIDNEAIFEKYWGDTPLSAQAFKDKYLIDFCDTIHSLSTDDEIFKALNAEGLELSAIENLTPKIIPMASDDGMLHLGETLFTSLNFICIVGVALVEVPKPSPHNGTFPNRIEIIFHDIQHFMLILKGLSKNLDQQTKNRSIEKISKLMEPNKDLQEKSLEVLFDLLISSENPEESLHLLFLYCLYHESLAFGFGQEFNLSLDSFLSGLRIHMANSIFIEKTIHLRLSEKEKENQLTPKINSDTRKEVKDESIFQSKDLNAPLRKHFNFIPAPELLGDEPDYTLSHPFMQLAFITLLFSFTNAYPKLTQTFESEENTPSLTKHIEELHDSVKKEYGFSPALIQLWQQALNDFQANFPQIKLKHLLTTSDDINLHTGSPISSFNDNTSLMGTKPKGNTVETNLISTQENDEAQEHTVNSTFS